MNISIIIPNYNGEKILQKNLPAVLEAAKTYDKGKVEIIIPDDPSTDNSQKVIEGFIASITDKHIVGKTVANKNKNESGFSKNVQRGVSLATGEILVLLNSDVHPRKDFLAPLVAHFADSQVFAVGCMDESIEDGRTVLRGRGIAKWEKGFFIHGKGKVDKHTNLWASGGSSAFRKSLWEKFKGFDLLFNPFYWEDIDLSYRAIKSGYQVLFEPRSIVTHEHAQGAIRNKFKPQQVKKIAYRNHFIFIWKNITDVSLLLSHFCWLPFHMVSAARRRDKAFFTGFFLALSQLSRISRSREQAQKFFVTTDKKVIKEHCE
jgi:O-antigen biosynthesis protein